MKVLILGGDGMLGHMAVKYFKSRGHLVFSTTRSPSMGEDQIYLDVLDKDFSLQRIVNDGLPLDWKPDYIVNCIGVIKPYSEVNIENTIFINSMFPHILARQGEECGIKVIHITTDCVYSGSEGSYNETSKFDPLDVYGKTKSLGEPKNCFVLRTSIIGPEKKGRLSLLEWFFQQDGKEVNGFDNHFWNGLTTLECSKVIEQIMEEGLFENGTKHIFSTTVSKFDMLNEFKNVYGTNIKINKISTKDKLDRTLTTTNHGFLNKLKILSFREMVSEMKEFYEKN
jgi:dTDP-4-dehydrorhamnose reductase